ncbi:MAG: electron transfer flavoprotein subunit beta/FixA family protein [Chlorobi bacterium]|nr:electron transfer flavoprotein subunit beta/FixA family protein [Chlorobiota bacterium]
MKILVTLGNVPDTTTKARFADGDTHLDMTGVQWIINPWDELALTRAMELKEDAANPVDHVTVVTVGTQEAEPTIRKALAIGADDAIRVNAEAKDAWFTAQQIAAAVKDQDFDLILTGIESSDYNGAAVGGMVAELLDLTSISAVSGVELNGNEITLHRDIDGGSETVQADLPLVAIVQKGIAKEPRIPAMRGIMMARKKPLQVVDPVEADALTSYNHFELPQPKPPCKMIDPEHVEELVSLLQNEAKVI